MEYKEIIPEKSIKYMKTVVAFSNCNGGRIIFGIQDKTRKVTGINNDDIFSKIDAITNAISDSCYPTIIPEISLQTIDEKTVIVVEIPIGYQKPYYIKSLGIQQDVFIRVGATTRLADDYMVKELIFEGENRFFDQSLCYGMKIDQQDIENLCLSLKQTALHNCANDDERKNIKDITKNQLIKWGILIEKDGNLLPSNAFALLTGNNCIPTKIQCGVFKGKTREIFVDRREFEGSLQNQIDEAYKYVLSKINLGAKINGLYREDIYEIPESSIREIIVNSIAHRSYLDPGNIQIALYDDRLEVTSPGMLLQGVTIEKMKEGYSKVRNRAIASAFTYMRYIEEWGSGIPRIFAQFHKRGLKEPELIDLDGDFRVNFYRPTKDDLPSYKEGDQW
ncbi:ATP-binding protein [Thomasclavelia sp.]|uniref:ATP-binding protein n=1 Tax=Thomasclavelia sp. TaxID=3025757 RepID=UPI0025D52EEE|nr:ATP-binding protein [Thomasclavelia sp.]